MPLRLFLTLCSAPLDQGQSPAGKAAYPGGPGTKITSVSTGNLCADVSRGHSDTWTRPSPLLIFITSASARQDEPSPPRPEAYPIPTQAYPRDYFTIPASKSQDRVLGPGQGPSQHWQGLEDRERLPVVDNLHNSMQVEQLRRIQDWLFNPGPRHRGQLFQALSFPPQRISHFSEEMYPPPGGLRPEERLQQHYQQDYQLRDLDNQGRDLDYQRGLQGKTGPSEGHTTCLCGRYREALQF